MFRLQWLFYFLFPVVEITYWESDGSILVYNDNGIDNSNNKSNNLFLKIGTL